MEEALSFFRAFEAWIYLLLGIGGLVFIRKFILAWQELRSAVFGLERESAQARLNQASTFLVFFLALAIAEFVLVYFIAPSVPGAIPLPSATLNLLATDTLPVNLPPGGGTVEGTGIPTFASVNTPSGCIPGQIEITFPQNGQEIRGVIEVLGTADIPNFGFYKFEIKRPDESLWLTIQAGNSVVRNGKLGDWDTSRLTPGEYELGLVVVDNQAQASAVCMVKLRVLPPLDTTPNP